MAAESGRGAVGSGGSPLGPVGESERLKSLDALRGVALLGILPMNAPHVAFHGAQFFNPSFIGPLVGFDRLLWLFGHLLFDMKMMSIFSMLFGAGLVMMDASAARRERSATGIVYRRLGWLLLIGLAHGYMLWSGDILFTYALCGMIVFPLRRLPATWLAVLGVCVLMPGVLVSVGQSYLFEMGRDSGAEWYAEIGSMTHPDDETLAKERAAFTGGYGAWVVHNAASTFFMQTWLFVTWALWRVTGLMLLGMALMKWGVFTARRSVRFYTVMAIVGYGVGLPVVYFGAMQSEAHGFDVVSLFRIDWNYNYLFSIPVALGHVSVVMLLCKSGVARWLVDALAAVGRMALTNYLAQSVIFCVVFLGWGFGVWGRVDRAGVWGFVVAVWLLQLVVSPLWLARFRFGPAEWVWRSLTYWKVQPMRRAAPSGVG